MKTLVNQVLEKCILELRKDTYKEQIKTYLIDPSICYILDRLYPYIIITAIIFILILLIGIAILFLMIKNRYRRLPHIKLDLKK